MTTHDLKFDMILRGIIMTRGENGATIGEMRDDYFQLTCEPWPLCSSETNKIIKYLLQIDGLIMEKSTDGLCVWYIDDIGNDSSEQLQDSNNNNSNGVSSATDDPSTEMRGATDNIQHGNYRSCVSSIPYKKQKLSTSSTSEIQVAETSLHFIETNGSVVHLPNGKRRQQFEALNQENVSIHNQHNGTNNMTKRSTSTEKTSLSNAQIGMNGSIDRILVANGSINLQSYTGPISENESQQIRSTFKNQCRIAEDAEKTQSTNTIDTSTVSNNSTQPDFCVIGDHLMRSLLSYSIFQKDETDKNHEQLDFCRSNQTIRDAYTMLLDRQDVFVSNYKYVIVTVGAIDILLNRDLTDIEADYTRLIRSIEILKLKPIITTLPPIKIDPFNKNFKQMYQMLLMLNRYILETYNDGYLVIDLWSHFKKKGIEQHEFYQNIPKCLNIGGEKLEIYTWSYNTRLQITNAINTFILGVTPN